MSGSILSYTNIVAKTLAEVDILLHNYVYSGYMALSNYLRIPLGIIAAMYIALFGYAVMIGTVKVEMGAFIKSVLKIAIIYVGVTEWAMVSEYLVGLVNSALGSALITASPVHIPGFGGIDGAMQQTLNQFSALGTVVFKTGGFKNFGGWVSGITIWSFGYVTVGIGLFEIILSKVMLAILFVFTPLMVIFCFFKSLQSVFDKWLGAIIGFALLQLFVTAALALALSLAYWWVGFHINAVALETGNYGTLPVIIIGIICIGVILKAAHLAQNLGGVATNTGGSALVGGMVGGALGYSMASFRMGKGVFGIGGKMFGLSDKETNLTRNSARLKSVESGLKRMDSQDE